MIWVIITVGLSFRVRNNIYVDRSQEGWAFWFSIIQWVESIWKWEKANLKYFYFFYAYYWISTFRYNILSLFWEFHKLYVTLHYMFFCVKLLWFLGLHYLFLNNNAVKRFILFTFTRTIFVGLKPALNQLVYRFSINQPPSLTFKIPETINAFILVKIKLDCIIIHIQKLI